MQHVAIRHLEDRVTRAITLCRADEEIPDLDCLVVCGGVAANQQVRSRLLAVAEKHEIRAVFPPGARPHNPPIFCCLSDVVYLYCALEKVLSVFACLFFAVMFES